MKPCLNFSNYVKHNSRRVQLTMIFQEIYALKVLNMCSSHNVSQPTSFALLKITLSNVNLFFILVQGSGGRIMCYGTNEAQAHNNACLVESICRDKFITKIYQVYQINSEETFRLNKEETRLWVGAQLAGYRRKLKQANKVSLFIK